MRILINLLGPVVLSLSVIAPPSPINAQSTEWNTAVSYIRQQLDGARVPGYAIAVVSGDEIIYMEGFGQADADGRPITPQTPFIIGSLSKSITATALMVLVEAGEVDLDTPVQAYLPDFRVANEAASQQMTVRHVLNHASGLTTLEGNLLLTSRDTSSDALQRRLATLADAQLAFFPGTGWQYSSANYDIAGAIIEAVTGQPYEMAVQTTVFDPLGMHNSYTSKTIAEQNGLAVGHRYWFGMPIAAPDLPYSRTELPTALLISSAEDVAHMLIAHLNEGVYDGQQILSADSIQALQRGTAPTPWGDAYGMGWFDEDWDGVRVLNHFGSFGGYHANMMIALESGWGMVVLTNAESYICNDDRWNAPKNGFRLLLGLDTEPPPLVSLSCGLFALMLALLVGMIGEAVLIVRYHRHVVRWVAWSAIAGHLLVAGLLWFGIPRLFNAPLSVVFLTTPDAGITILATSTLALVIGLCWILVLCRAAFHTNGVDLGQFQENNSST